MGGILLNAFTETSREILAIPKYTGTHPFKMQGHFSSRI
jgi:hypothetical protein